MKPSAALFALALLFCSGAVAQASPAELISNFRIKHGEGRVTSDATLDRIALEQAKAMAAKDTLSHEVLGSFGSRISPAGAGRAGENIAYGYDGFEKTLDQWINSPEHRRNLLLHNASRIGVASVRSETSHRTYWAMEIAGDYSSRTASRNPPRTASKKKKIVSPAEEKTAARTCHLKLLGVCF
jgi:Cysteine-rich secretory protein family